MHSGEQKMQKLKSFLSRQIEDYLRRVDFDVSKIDYVMNDFEIDKLGLPEKLEEYLKEMMKGIFDGMAEGANTQVQNMIEEIIEQIDPDDMAEALSKQIGKKVMTFQPVVHMTDPICPSCYRMYGQWTTDSGALVPETEINRNGTRIIVADDF